MTEELDRAFAAAPRTWFLPRAETRFAALDRPLPIGHGQTNSQPTTVRHLLGHLDVRPGQRVLDVGCGSGWTTALLAQLVKQPDIAQEAAAKVVCESDCLTPEQRGTAWLVDSEVSTELDKSGALRMALAAFQRTPNSKPKGLTLLRIHTRLANQYRFNGQPFYSRWHTWCSKILRLCLRIGSRCQPHELEKACTNRVPPTLRDI